MNYARLLICFSISMKATFIFSQNYNLRDTVAFKALPDTLQKAIIKKASDLYSKDTIMGSFIVYNLNHYTAYSYKAFLVKNILVGDFIFMSGCGSCAAEAIKHEASFKTVVLYCCKDPSHKPNETEKTKNAMLEIQKKNHCKTIGICFY